MAQALAFLPPVEDPDLLVGTNTADDAGVYRLSDDLALVKTIDILTPVVEDAYTFGKIEIDGERYTSDVIILPTGVRPGWWRREGHSIVPEDLNAALEAVPEVLIIGRGAHGMMNVPGETLVRLRQAGIQVICLPTAQAVETYNDRTQQGSVVVAALHLTC